MIVRIMTNNKRWYEIEAWNELQEARQLTREEVMAEVVSRPCGRRPPRDLVLFYLATCLDSTLTIYFASQKNPGVGKRTYIPMAKLLEKAFTSELLTFKSDHDKAQRRKYYVMVTDIPSKMIIMPVWTLSLYHKEEHLYRGQDNLE